MQPTSVSAFEGCTRLTRAFVKNDATDFVIGVKCDATDFLEISVNNPENKNNSESNPYFQINFVAALCAWPGNLTKFVSNEN